MNTLHLLAALALSLSNFAPPNSRGGALLAQEPTWTQEELESATERIRVQIEELRGERFLRPVEVRLTDGAGFLRHMTERVEKLLPEGELEIDEAVAKLLGLIPPEMDMWKVTEELLEEQVGGFYDPGKDTFYLMESFTGGLAEIILAHELTHALDDQLYDIDGTLKRLLENGDAANAYHAVVEGSGTSLMTSWMLKYGRDLDPTELAGAMSMGQAGLDKAPAYLWKPLLHAYTGGQRFINRGYRLRDKAAGESLADIIRRSFQDPPRSTEQVLHPDKYWKESERDEPRVIVQEVGALPEGWESVGERVLGELTLALLTDDWAKVEALDLSDPMKFAFMSYTNPAAQGWGGDSLVYLRKEGAGLVRLATLWDRPEDVGEFAAAIEVNRARWLEQLAAQDAGGIGHGLAFMPQAAADELTLVAWFGATAEEALGVARAVTASEVAAVGELDAR